MSKKSAKATFDDLIGCLLEHDGINTLIDRLFDRITPKIEKLFDKLADNFKRKLEKDVEKTATEVATDVASRTCDALTQKIIDLEEANSTLEARLDEVANYYRMSNLVVHGLPETSYAGSVSGADVQSEMPPPSQSSQDTVTSIVNLCNDRLGLAVDETAISSAYRIPRGKKDAHRPIIVRFTSQRVRNSILAARKSLRSENAEPGSGKIFINEHLTRMSAAIFARTRALLKEGKIVATWTMNGTVYVRRSETHGEKPKKILALRDLRSNLTRNTYVIRLSCLLISVKGCTCVTLL